MRYRKRVRENMPDTQLEAAELFLLLSTAIKDFIIEKNIDHDDFIDRILSAILIAHDNARRTHVRLGIEKKHLIPAVEQDEINGIAGNKSLKDAFPGSQGNRGRSRNFNFSYSHSSNSRPFRGDLGQRGRGRGRGRPYFYNIYPVGVHFIPTSKQSSKQYNTV